MGYRNLFIESNCRLTTKDNQLIIKQTEEFSIPIEDINIIIIDSLACNISTYLIAKLTEYDVLTYICNDKHLPKCIMLSVNSHSRRLKRLNEQLQLSKPLTKRLWQNIIIQKILNQAMCLELLNISNYKELINLSCNVQSGDTTNIESTAAANYFKQLGFFRNNSELVVNSALDYGYAIIRGMICRTLATYGFEPSIGLFHHNELNNFNLADDLIECFRPLVDLYILTNIPFDTCELTTDIKRVILNVTNQLVLIDGKKYNVQTAIDQMIMSLATTVREGSNCLKLPSLIKLEEYSYG